VNCIVARFHPVEENTNSVRDYWTNGPFAAFYETKLGIAVSEGFAVVNL
jgi:hypothetical protein